MSERFISVANRAFAALLPLAVAAVALSASAQAAPASAGPYSAQPLTLAARELRIDVLPPDWAYMDHGEINNGRGLWVYVPEQGEAGVGLGVGAGYGIQDSLEVGGLVFPFLFHPDFDFGDMEIYWRYAFLRGASQLGLHGVLRIPTASDFAVGIGLPARFALGSGARLDTGVELEMVFANNARANLDLPFAFNFDLGGSAYVGGRTGVFFADFEEMAIDLGMQGGGRVDPMVELGASIDFPRFLWTGRGDAVNPDFVLVAGATIYLDLR